jgi:cytochrome c oxidase assembly factor CtaG
MVLSGHLTFAWVGRWNLIILTLVVPSFFKEILRILIHLLLSIVSVWLIHFPLAYIRETVDNLGHPVNCVSLSNDSNCLLANCLDSTVRLVDK